MGLRTNLKNTDRNVWTDGRVTIKPIETEEELAYAVFFCELKEEQKEFVNPAGFSIGRAYLSREDNLPCLIFAEDKKPVGFINLCRWLGEGDAYSFSFYIDKDHQGKGYGKSAASTAVRILKAADPSKQVKLSAEKGNTRAHKLYVSLGLKKLPELDGDDFVFGI